MAYTLSQVRVDDAVQWTWMWEVTEPTRRAAGVRSQLFRPSPAEPSHLVVLVEAEDAALAREYSPFGPRSAARLLDALEA